MTTWYLVIFFLGYKGVGGVTVPQPSKQTCEQNVLRLLKNDSYEAFCVEGK